MKDYSETENRYRTLCEKLHDYKRQGNGITEAVDIVWHYLSKLEVINDWETIEQVLPTFAEIVELEIGA